MKKISDRSNALLVFLGILLVGLLLFFGIFFVKGEEWIVFPGNPYTYSGSQLSQGTVVDRAGTVLMDNSDGRSYAEDALVRKATLHLLGDRDGYITAPLLTEYASELAGFDPVNGVYRFQSEQTSAKLTISANVQVAALEALGNYRGTIGVYNYRTGEILCAVSTPTYDPDQVPDIAGDTSGRYDGVYVNRFFNATFTPGSIFKLVTAAAALENLEDVAERQFTCQGEETIDGGKLICNDTHGVLDFQTALAKSCNIAFGQLAMELGGETLNQYVKRYALTQSLEIDGITTAAGQFDVLGKEDLEIAWAGVGQSTDLINPCSFLRFVGIIAGGGEAAEPFLVSSVGTQSKEIYRAKTQSTGRVMGEETAKTLQEMMANNVKTVYGQGNFGTLSVCAKSGTAEVGGESLPNATFAGFVQDEEYPLAFVIVVQDAGSGSQVCTQMAASVLRACTAALDAEKDS